MELSKNCRKRPPAQLQFSFVERHVVQSSFFVAEFTTKLLVVLSPLSYPATQHKIEWSNNEGVGVGEGEGDALNWSSVFRQSEQFSDIHKKVTDHLSGCIYFSIIFIAGASQKVESFVFCLLCGVF